MEDFYRAMERDGMRPAAALRAGPDPGVEAKTVELSLGCHYASLGLSRVVVRGFYAATG